MTPEEKDLLLQDLCARLPYGVKCNVGDDKPYTLSRIEIDDKNGHLLDFKEKKDGLDMQVYLSEVKPYLFPLSSMTDKQREELYKIGWYLDEDKIYSCFRNYDDANYQTHIDGFELINWCYKNHFDINGRILMGLANDATGLNIY